MTQITKQDFPGPIVIIGFGSIGTATIPLIHRHINHTYQRPIVIISPDASNQKIAEEYDAIFMNISITPENYTSILSKLIGNDKPRGMVIQVANEVSSKSIMEYCLHHNAHYIDTVVEPWPGFYKNFTLTNAQRSNYALREDLLTLKKSSKGLPTAISCCGANPGMVSWFIKSALLKIARDLNVSTVPKSRIEWVQLMCMLGVKGIQIAERDTQTPFLPRKNREFVNTWSISGFIAEGLQPAELGWGTHERVLPPDGRTHTGGSKASIYLETPGMKVKVHTWTPSNGEHFGYLITHNEAISIADYYTLKDNIGNVIYRPTCYYAYHPTDATVESIDELLESSVDTIFTHRLLHIEDIASGADELGVLLFGHERGAYWYGSTLTVTETKNNAPHQNPTGLQVSSAILAGFLYTIKCPNEGLLETDEIDHEFCLSIQEQYLGNLKGYYTDGKFLSNSNNEWQFNDMRIV